MVYHITVHGEYDFDKADDSIVAARSWAKQAFPGKRVTINRSYRLCPWCLSAPCSGCNNRHED